MQQKQQIDTYNPPLLQVGSPTTEEELDERTNGDNLACARLGRTFKLQLFERRMLRSACFTAKYVIHHAYKTHKLTCLESTSVSAAIVPCARTLSTTRFFRRVYD